MIPPHPYLFILSVSTEPERMVVSVESAGGAGVSRLGTGTEGDREVQSEVDSIADLLGGAGRQLEQVLVVRKDVIEGRVVLVANILNILINRDKPEIFQCFQCWRDKLRLSLTIHPG